MQGIIFLWINDVYTVYVMTDTNDTGLSNCHDEDNTGFVVTRHIHKIDEMLKSSWLFHKRNYAHDHPWSIKWTTAIWESNLLQLQADINIDKKMSSRDIAFCMQVCQCTHICTCRLAPWRTHAFKLGTYRWDGRGRGWRPCNLLGFIEWNYMRLARSWILKLCF